MLFSNIQMMREILELVVIDWERETTPLQTAIDNASSEGETLFHVSKAFNTLQPFFLKGIFSYAVFFVALEGAYDRFYEELNILNRKPFLRVLHDKKPKPTPYIEKVRRIRNISVAHIGSKKASPANAIAAMMWQPMTIRKKANESWDLNKMAFGDMKHILSGPTGAIIDESDDFEITGIVEMDNLCRQYLDEYDDACTSYLKAILAKLPITIGDEQYFEFKTTVPTS